MEYKNIFSSPIGTPVKENGRKNENVLSVVNENNSASKSY